MNKEKQYRAFTLAEVLIVLVIIGIIAAITLPAIMQSTQDAELKNAWKNDYAIINQAYQKATLDNGGDMALYLKTNDGLAPALISYFVNIKYCANSPTAISPCFSPQISELNSKTVGNDGLSSHLFDDGGFIWQNGATLAFENNGTENYNGIFYAYIWVDVNGFKQPNIIGKDIFGIVVLKDRLVPMGATVPGIPGLGGLPNETTCDSSTSGIACSSLYLQQ